MSVHRATCIALLFVAGQGPSFSVRQKAAAELERFDELAEPFLRTALAATPSLEVRRRVERLLENIPGGQTPDRNTQRALRAVAVLESLATPEARALLHELSTGAAGAMLTSHALSALRRLSKVR